MKQKLIPGMICSVDPNNICNQDMMGIHHVVLLEKIKRRLFGNSIWKVRSIDIAEDDIDRNIHYLNCQEKLLYPANMVIIRNPIDMPIISDMDSVLLGFTIQYLENRKDFSNIHINKLSKLKEKLDFYKSMKEV